MDEDIDNSISGLCVCHECGERDNYRDIVIDSLGGVVTEKERVCNNCDCTIDYWAYGYWESKYKNK